MHIVQPDNIAPIEKSPSAAAYTLEVTGKEIRQIEIAAPQIPPGTPINIAFLGNENHDQRVNAARVIRECGFEPVPIISSRRLRSEEDLNNLITQLNSAARPSRFIFVGGDPATPEGPYTDSLALLASGVLQRHDIHHVGIVGYPDGHPKISADNLWHALEWKYHLLRDANCTLEITTQFGFDTEAIVRWIRQLRDHGIDAPVHIGVPGPASIGQLLRYARQFGVVASTEIAGRYGLSLATLLRKSVADHFWADLISGLAEQEPGDIGYHLYPFGGIKEGVRWMNSRVCSGQPIPDSSGQEV